MALNVISNFAANVAHRNLVMSDAAATSSLTKLSSGQRVVSAKDDAASLAIGSRLRAEVVAMRTASVNAGQAGSMLQIADGAMATISDILVRMKELAVQSSSGQFSSIERTILDSEFQALKSEITRISDDTEFNGTQLIAGGATTSSGIAKIDATNNKIDVGFTSFTFDKSVTDGAFELTFNAANNTLTATDLISGAVEAVVLDVTAINAQATGASTDIKFDTLGLTVALNNGFDGATDITTTATLVQSAGVFDSGSGGQLAIAAGIVLGSVDIQSTLGIDFGDNTTVVLAIAAGGADNADATLTLAGTGGTNFTGVLKTDATGVQTVTLTRNGVDTAGVAVTDTITLKIDVTGTSLAADDSAVNVTLSNLFNVAFADQTGDATKTSFTFKVGTGNQSYDSLTFDVNAASASALSLTSSKIDTAADSETASTAVSAAIDTLNQSRATIGAAQNRLTFASANLASAIENAEAARSNLLDLDVAAEITVFTSKQVLLQTGIAMLAQANQLPQNLLRLFQ